MAPTTRSKTKAAEESQHHLGVEAAIKKDTKKPLVTKFKSIASAVIAAKRLENKLENDNNNSASPHKLVRQERKVNLFDFKK